MQQRQAQQGSHGPAVVQPAPAGPLPMQPAIAPNAAQQPRQNPKPAPQQHQRQHKHPPQAKPQPQHRRKSTACRSDAFGRLRHLEAVGQASLRVSQTPADEIESTAAAVVRHLRERKTIAVAICANAADKQRCIELIRAKLRQSGSIGLLDKTLRVLRPEPISNNLKLNPAFYEGHNRLIEFDQAVHHFQRGERYSVGCHNGGLMLHNWRSSQGAPVDLPENCAHAFSVYSQTQLKVSEGDHIRMTQTRPHFRYIHGVDRDHSSDLTYLEKGQVHRIRGFSASHELTLDDGRALPDSYAHLDSGYAVTPDELPLHGIDHLIASDASLLQDQRVVKAAIDARRGVSLGTSYGSHHLSAGDPLPNLSRFARAATYKLEHQRQQRPPSI